ncbi:MAG: UDP-3-O-[3-hydroxymyristoyl] N-acetylglucosamine deacetylase [Candidatus Riflebacteria bacterium]|nr:UDP-3-O-[3-hydroxymyristoyl] N-acetylglucosamine deacetylase [Candidatus Riflebacteria bacterium]
MDRTDQQTTLARETSVQGVGLHTGQHAILRFHPAPPDHGIVFKRVDIPGGPLFPVTWQTVTDGGIRGTNLEVHGHTTYTVEHLLAACHGLGIDNLLIELDAPELPVLDGSAQPIVARFQEAGLVSQDAPRRVYRLRQAVDFSDERGSVTAVPADVTRISYTLQYSNPVIGCQFKDLVLTAESFCQELAAARTFCLLEEVESLRLRNLGLGGSLENAVVVDNDRVLNDSLRWPDEFVRHKLLDLVGDLFIAGKRILGHFIGHRSGHRHNVSLVKKLFQNKALDLEVPREGGAQFDVRRIWDLIPHRFPFLLVDKIIELEVGTRAVGMKNVTINEPFFQGHFPERPIMPGVLVLEALAQVAAVCTLSMPVHKGRTPFFTGMDSVHFRKPIVPGDQIRLEVEVDKIRGNMGRVRGRALVEGQVAAEGVLKFTVL